MAYCTRYITLFVYHRDFVFQRNVLSAQTKLSFVASNCGFVTFQLVSWSGVVLDCIDSCYRFLIFAPLLTLTLAQIYIYRDSESTEPIDAVSILPLARSEPTTSATPPSTTPDINATNCATESSPKKDVQEALILMATDAVHVVYWFFFFSMDGIYFVRK